MDNLQDVLTLAATVVEYFFFGYLAVAFMAYSLKSPTQANPWPIKAAPQTPWEQSVAPTASLAGMAG